ncbi:MAG TPA: HAMP domain-containing protein [Actinobacteria bacterium]|nr:HAMP domain-containing protein [Actinomycetota bacterium]
MRIGIQQKLGAVVLILMAISLGIIALAYSGFENLHGQADKGAKYFLEFSTVTQLQVAIERKVAPIKLFLISGSEEQIDRYESAEKEFHRLLSELKKNPTVHGRKLILINEIELHDNHIKEIAETIFEAPGGIDQEIRMENAEEVDHHFEEVTKLVEEWRKLDTKEVEESLVKVEAIYDVERQLIASSLAILIIGAAISFSVTQFVIKPIIELHKGVENISKGGDEFIPQIRTHDEIQDLAEAFSRMVRNLRAEEKMAAKIQNRLLPQKKLQTPGVHIQARQFSARVVGGDWFDYYQYEDEIRILIADASGKGVPGALLATVGMSAIRAEPKFSSTIEQVLIKANKTVSYRFGRADFITLFSAQFSQKDNRFHYINCGHEPPLHFKAKDQTWTLMDCSPGLPLGISVDLFRPKRRKIVLDPGDKVLLYTDGLHSVRDEKKDFLGVWAIRDWLNKQEELSIDSLMDKLLDKVVAYNHGPISDDITLLGLEMTAAADKQIHNIPSDSRAEKAPT